MKNLGSIVAAVVIIGIVALLLFSNKNDGSNVTQQEAPQSFASVTTDITANSGVLLDVRTAEEYAAGHIDGAINLSLQDIQTGTVPSVDTSAPVYVYCRSGNRSAQAATLLKEAGYTNITDLGAMAAVEKLGGTITTN